MKEFERFISLMNSSQKKYPVKHLTEMWANWHCDDELLKRTTKQMNMTRDDRKKLVLAMGVLNIEEDIQLMGNRARLQPVYFNNETKGMYAIKQHYIVLKSQYRERKEEI